MVNFEKALKLVKTTTTKRLDRQDYNNVHIGTGTPKLLDSPLQWNDVCGDDVDRRFASHGCYKFLFNRRNMFPRKSLKIG
ncbi:hypothetical protein TNCT_438641 [Trichonephila clavata]|uniref:Uncharacterized protein n=1 Tax=Trichonephila clavata TaxID=2740835 RepID=A0A8X6JZC4_TRICU|nr:hypothetical protein TNCT_438641 [Trichonephila clavata]